MSEERHSARFEPPDIIRWTLAGEVTLEDALALNRANEEFLAAHPCHYLVIDMSQGIKVSNETRSYWVKSNNGSAASQLYTVVFGGSHAMRAIASLILSALMLAPTKRKPQVKFVGNEHDALHAIA